MKNSTSLLLCLLCVTKLFSQNIGIGTTNPGATLELFDTASSTIRKTFLVRSNYSAYPWSPVDTLFQVSNNGNVGIGAGKPGGRVDIFGKMGDSVLLNIHGAANMIFGSDAVLRFSGDYPNLGYFDIGAHFPENSNDRYLSISGLLINRLGSVIIGGQPNFGFNANSLTINHNAAYEQGVALALTEYANQTPVRISLQNYAAGIRNWEIASFAAQNSDSAYISFRHFGGVYTNSPILFTGSGKLGVNATEIAPQAQVQINGRNNPNNTPLLLNNVQEYPGNTEALAAGLPAGAVYRTGDLLKIVH